MAYISFRFLLEFVEWIKKVLSKITWIGVAAIVGGFLEGLGNDLYHYITSFQGINFSPYVIPAVLGIAGFSLILYDFINKRRERKNLMMRIIGNIFLLILHNVISLNRTKTTCTKLILLKEIM